MSVEVTITCPLGSVCERIVDGKLERCAWYVKMVGTNPNTGEDVDEARCAIAWQPLLAVDTNGKLDQTVSSVQSMRNETIKRQDLALGVVANANKTIERL